MSALIANSLWCATSLPSLAAFMRATRNVQPTQERLLFDLLRRNEQSEWGRRYGFARIRSVADYQSVAPLTSYNDYAPVVERIANGEQGLLTREPVLLLEPTGGSTTGSKLIPYTAALKAEFQRAIAPWVANMFRHDLALLTGPAYWSVSPVTQGATRSNGGLPIGFEDDSAYLGGFAGALVRAALAAPPLLRLVEDMETFRYLTLLFLLHRPDLTLASVWSPTFLSLLVEPLRGWGEQLAYDIATGSLTPPSPLAPSLRTNLASLLRASPSRAATLRQALREPDAGTLHAQIWPRLRAISCWADGHAAMHLSTLRRLFPQATILPKGLVATEAIVSLPLQAHTTTQERSEGLAICSHFFEFLPENSDQALLAHEIEPSQRYSVVVTTGGGLYRYRLGDSVEVTGFLNQCPLLRFVGREAAISDRFGEKLHERHVGSALDALLADYGIHATFAMLAPDEHSSPMAYTLFIEAYATNAQLCDLGTALEERLLENFHYRYCRDLGQLAPLRMFRIETGGAATYLAARQASGQRLGDIKPVALDPIGGWAERFYGRYVLNP